MIVKKLYEVINIESQTLKKVFDTFGEAHHYCDLNPGHYVTVQFFDVRDI